MTRRSRHIKAVVVGVVSLLLLALGGLAEAQTCVLTPDGLVSWWPGDGNANDTVGGNHGTLVGGATFAPGLVGQAFSFDGVDDALFTPLIVSYSTGVTFDAWIKTSDDRGIIMSGGGGASRERGMGLFIEPGGVLSLFGARNVGGQFNFLIFAGHIADGTFHHVAATWTGDTSQDGVKLYLDGVLVGTATAVTSIATDSLPLHIGGHTTLGHFRLQGVIDEVEVYSRVLTASEISAIFNAGNAGKCKSVSVEIDIKPGGLPNSINPRSKGVIPVAIVTTDSFDAATVEPTTVLFGRTGIEAAAVHSVLEDVDGDGDFDLILHFSTQDTGILCGDTSASLTGETFDGQPIEGSDSIQTAGCK